MNSSKGGLILDEFAHLCYIVSEDLRPVNQEVMGVRLRLLGV